MACRALIVSLRTHTCPSHSYDHLWEEHKRFWPEKRDTLKCKIGVVFFLHTQLFLRTLQGLCGYALYPAYDPFGIKNEPCTRRCHAV
jgi:hypothetical protein